MASINDGGNNDRVFIVLTTESLGPYFGMDRQRLEYNAILEQVTREASQQAERDLRARAQAEVVRNFPGNILNRLDIQARLGSRVAPIEERIL